MLLNKYVDKKDLERLEAEAGYIRKSLEAVKEVGRGGPEAIGIALKMLKDYREKIVVLKNNCLNNPNHVKMLRSLGFAGEERSLNYVIGLFENPKSQIAFYESQLAPLEKTINEWKKRSVRE